MAAYAVLVAALLSASCVAGALVDVPPAVDALVAMTAAIGFNAAKCPPFPKSGCTPEACASPSAGQLFKFKVSRDCLRKPTSRVRASDMKFMRDVKH